GTAKGVIFMTLEDETGTANIIVWPKVFEKFRRAVLTARLLKITGRVQREGIVVHVIAETVEDSSSLLDSLSKRDASDQNEADQNETGTPGAQTPNDAGRRRPPSPGLRHPREQAKILFPSRDFH
ncbi:MAG: OB-fold nucleic acid binding domain-containing protein, partial [Alphaproteobacteria bacterium]